MLEVGTRLPHRGSSISADGLTKVATWAQQLGYHSVWVGDHVVVPADPEQINAAIPGMNYSNLVKQGMFDCLLALTWAAAVAPDLKLGTSVMAMPMRNPVVLAKQVST